MHLACTKSGKVHPPFLVWQRQIRRCQASIFVDLVLDTQVADDLARREESVGRSVPDPGSRQRMLVPAAYLFTSWRERERERERPRERQQVTSPSRER